MHPARLMTRMGALLVLLLVARSMTGCAEAMPLQGEGKSPAQDLHIGESSAADLSEWDLRYTESGKVAVDQDKDGHCAPGSTDPGGGVCKSLKDCDDTDRLRYPGAPETCDNEGVDNDCDGDKDEVDPNGDGKNDKGKVCPTGLPGICKHGSLACVSLKLVCTATVKVGQVSESCNGKDDDCNGSTDEGSLCTNGNSCAGSAGCQCKGATGCTGSQQCCASGCKSTSSDTANCGACGVACGTSETCDAGRCRCGSTYGTTGGGPACSVVCINASCMSCNPTQNIATLATASSSGGGTGSLGPQLMNDGGLESTCSFHWVSAPSYPNGQWIQYTWSSPVLVGSISLDTAPVAGSCSMSAGRTLAGGTIQYHGGSSWITLGKVSSKTDDWSYSFSPVTTTMLRVYDVFASNTGQGSNPMIFEWQVYCQ